MSLKPIDFQAMLPKTAEISRNNSNDQNKYNAVQKQQGITINNLAENSLRQVYSKEEAQEARIKERQERNKNKERRNSKDDKKQDKRNKNKSTNKKESIDIKI